MEPQSSCGSIHPIRNLFPKHPHELTATGRTQRNEFEEGVSRPWDVNTPTGKCDAAYGACKLQQEVWGR
jgi:hypothetical protein